MNVAVIPARGGSKRIPRKNVRPFAGRPMIAYSIECALRSRVFGRVIVSTDDAEIAAVARAHGGEVPFVRPESLADDYTGTVDVVAHAIETLRALGVALDAVCCLYATAPFVRPEDVRRGLALLESGDWAYVFAATEFAAPIFRSFEATPSGGVRMFFPNRFGARSQDLPEALHDAAQFYWARPETWLRRAPVFGEQSTVVRLPRWRVQDIDTEADWVRAESIAAYVAARGDDAGGADD